MDFFVVGELACSRDSCLILGRTLSGPNWERSEDEKKMCRALEKVAKEVGAKNIGSGKSISQLALGYL